MSKRRVVITGMGIKSPIGNSIENFFENMKNSKHGIAPIEFFDAKNLNVHVAAYDYDFNPTDYMDKKELRRTDRFCQMAIASSTDAIKDSRDFISNYDPYRIGVIYASGIGGLNTIESEYAKYLEKGASKVSVFLIPMMITNIAPGIIAIKNGIKGDNFSISTACASSNHAIGEAFRKIRDNYLDACITGGAEAGISEFIMAGFNNMTALTRSEDKDRASIPFDKERSGFVMGEGSGTLILEELEHAKKRNAKIYAEVVGYGATDDAYHITKPDPSATSAAKCMEHAINDAGISPCDIDYINAHGTSTVPNELTETKAIKEVFKDHAYRVSISSTKSMTGHMLGAAGAAEAIATSLALKNGLIPPTVGYKVKDDECDLDCTPNHAKQKDITYALSNSLGFGGHNAAICFKKYSE